MKDTRYAGDQRARRGTYLDANSFKSYEGQVTPCCVWLPSAAMTLSLLLEFDAAWVWSARDGQVRQASPFAALWIPSMHLHHN